MYPRLAFFFFSSRRRHTRYWRDWSSDVCSSDLDEDAAAMSLLGATPVYLGLPEAPHRGYTSAPDLFAGVHDGDDVWRSLTAALEGHEADLWLAPQALGGHGDHRQVVRAAGGVGRAGLGVGRRPLGV